MKIIIQGQEFDLSGEEVYTLYRELDDEVKGTKILVDLYYQKIEEHIKELEFILERNQENLEKHGAYLPMKIIEFPDLPDMPDLPDLNVYIPSFEFKKDL